MFRSVARIVFFPLLAAGLAGATLASAAADGWKVVHGDTANTSFIDRMTAPAQSPARIVGGIGSIADGSAPIVSGKGNVYLASEQGKVMAFRPDGTKWWEQDLGSGWSVRAAPALSDFDVLFLLATREATDHTVTPAVKRIATELVSFSEDGRLLSRRALPAHDFGAAGSAPLNFARGPDGQQVLVFPLRYAYSGGNQVVRLFAYALNNISAPLAEVVVSQHQASITGEQGIHFGHGFFIPAGDPDPGAFARQFQPPAPGAAIPDMPGLDPSLVTVNDTLGAIVRYRFTGDSFVETDRWRDGKAVSGPVVARNGVNLYARYDGVMIRQLDGTTQFRPIAKTLGATPTVRPNGVVLVPYWKGFGEAGTERSVDAGSQLAVSPSATRNHLYVASNFALITYRIDDLAEIARFDWRNGGRHQPAIGPRGEIYALADNKLHVFIPRVTGVDPGNVATGVTGPLGGAIDAGSNSGGARVQPMEGVFNPAILTEPGITEPSVTEPSVTEPSVTESGVLPEAPAAGQEAALPQAQTFDPPLTASGNRLSACSDDSFRHCGKEAAHAFCSSMGFAKARGIDIDRRKGPAETLGGALCTKNRCEVVDEVTCER